MGGQVEKPRKGLRARAKASLNDFLNNGKHSKKESGEQVPKGEVLGPESRDSSDKLEALGLTAASGGKEESASPWPEEFSCPISLQLMADPVIVESGTTYERGNVQAYLDMGHMTCLKTGETWRHRGLFRNIALKNLIDNWCDANQVTRPVPPDASSARANVHRACGGKKENDANDETTSSTTLSESQFSSEYPSGSGSGIASGSVNGSLRGSTSPATTPGDRPGIGRSSGVGGSNKSRPAQIPEALCVDGSVIDNSYLDKPHEKLHYREHHTWSSGSDGNKIPSGGIHAKEWPPAPSGLAHSASTSNPSIRARQIGSGGVPLPLTTKPSAFSKSGSSRGSSGGVLSPVYVGELTGDKVNELVMKLQQTDHPAEQEGAVVEIRRLSRVSAENRLALCDLVLEDVMPLVESPYTGVQINAVASVMNMSLEKDNKLKVARAGGIPRLVYVLQSGLSEAQELAAGAIFSLALNDENKMAIGALGGIPPLLYVLQKGQRGARRDAAMALYHLSFSQLNRNKLVKAGGVEIFLDIAKDERSDVVSGVLMILSNIAASKDGREALAKMKGVQVMVGLLTRGDDGVGGALYTDSTRGTKEESKINWAEVREHAAATLLQLSHHSFRFKSLALEAGALEGLQRLLEEGTPRAREKATTLLAILRDSPHADGNFEDNSPMYRRSHRPFGPVGAANKSDSAQF